MNILQASYLADQTMIDDYQSVIRMRRGKRFGQIEYQCAIQREEEDVEVSEWTDANGAHLASLAMLASMNIKLLNEAEMLIESGENERIYDPKEIADEPGMRGGVRSAI